MPAQCDHCNQMGNQMARTERVLALDWLRGLGVLIMLQGHLFNSFARPDLHQHPVYVLSQFIGGMPAPMFLFLVGVTLGFRLDRGDRAGLSPAARWKSAMARAGFLAAIAFAFRFQLWVFAWGNPWTEIFRVDILNCMALGVAVLSPVALLQPRKRITWCVAAGLDHRRPGAARLHARLVRRAVADPQLHRAQQSLLQFLSGRCLHRFWSEFRRTAAHRRTGSRPHYAMVGLFRTGAHRDCPLFFQSALLHLSGFRFLAQ